MKIFRRTLSALLLLTVIGTAALHLRIEYLVHRPVPTTIDPAYAAAADQFYFAYGSNMSIRYLYNLRGILPAQSQAGTIDNHEVRFLDSSITGTTQAFAYLMKADGKKAYGVLHRVSKRDLEKIKASEEAIYEWVTLPVRLRNGQVVPSQTLLRVSPGHEGKPSRRYQQILIEGGAENGLPATYLADLRGMQSVYIPVVSELVGDIVQAVVMKNSGKCQSLIAC